MFINTIYIVRYLRFIEFGSFSKSTMPDIFITSEFQRNFHLYPLHFDYAFIGNIMLIKKKGFEKFSCKY